MAAERQAGSTLRYSPDRKGERLRKHLKIFSGDLAVDADAGFERLYDQNYKPGPITPVACWAHVRRKLHDVQQADPGSVAARELRMIRDLYEVERGIVQDSHEDRRKARTLSKLTVLDFFAWADDVRGQVSARGHWPRRPATRSGSSRRCSPYRE